MEKVEDLKDEQKLTIEQRIENLTQQKEQLKEMFLRVEGAIEVLKQVQEDETANNG